MRGDYDYSHATLNAQTIIIILLVVIGFCALGGLFLGLTLLTSIL